MICINVKQASETEAIGIKLGRLVNRGDIICLSGDLGAGKTTFTQAFAKGFGVEDYVSSPTFTIINEYQGRLPLYHFDVYRLENSRAMEDIGYEEYFYGDGVCVIEWASLIPDILPMSHLWIDIKVEGEFERNICIKGTNDYYEKMIGELLL